MYFALIFYHDKTMHVDGAQQLRGRNCYGGVEHVPEVGQIIKEAGYRRFTALSSVATFEGSFTGCRFRRRGFSSFLMHIFHSILHAPQPSRGHGDFKGLVSWQIPTAMSSNQIQQRIPNLHN